MMTAWKPRSIGDLARNFYLLYAMLGLFSAADRYCYECTGFQCMKNPHDPGVLPGRVKCHEVMEFCSSHIRYTFLNRTRVVDPRTGLRHLGPRDYFPTSATRSCAKVRLGNTCRRDWLNAPLITCITTCEEDLCNCDTRSPPPEMFTRDGKVLHMAPASSTYHPDNMLSCQQTIKSRTHGRGPSIGVDDDDNDEYDYDRETTTIIRRGNFKNNRKNQRRSFAISIVHSSWGLVFNILACAFVLPAMADFVQE